MTLTTTTIQQGIDPTKLPQGSLFTCSKWKQKFGCIISKKGQTVTVIWFNDEPGSLYKRIHTHRSFEIIDENEFWREI